MSNLAKRLARIAPALDAQQEQSRIIPFGEWLPDLPDFGNPGALSAKNVIPDAMSYRPFPGLTAQSSNALDATALGGFGARDAANNVYVYVGNASKLYELLDQAWVDESKGGGYATASGDVWEFANFGTDIIATNFTDPVQSMAIGGGAAGAFADLITSTNKPKAKHLDVVRDFLVLGNTNDTTDGHVPNRVWWSAINDAADFDPSATTQSDYQTMAEGGWVQRVVGGAEYGVIFQERQISRMEYVGWPLMFQIFPVDRRRGAPIPNSVIGHGRSIFYISEEGFYEFDGARSHPIGANKVDKTFWNQFDIGNKRNVTVAVDPVKKLVMWLFPGAGNTGGLPNKVFIFNWVERKWSEAEFTADLLLRVQTQGYTLDTLDSVSTNIDTGFTESFDSDVWKGGQYQFAAIDQDHKLAYFTGDNLVATVGTGEVQVTPGQRSLVTSVRPLVDGGASEGLFGTDATCVLSGRARLQDAVTSTSKINLNAIGECSVRVDARYHRVSLVMRAATEWSHAQGVDITYSPTGLR